MTVTRETYKEFIGRVNFGDIEPIINTPDVDFEAVDHVVKNDSDVIFTWDYSLVRPQLRKLYEKAKNNQWNGETALDWSTEVDVERSVIEDYANFGSSREMSVYEGSPVEHWGDKEWLEFATRDNSYIYSLS